MKSLLPEAQHERFDVVLVSPRNPLNIGAAARAMANFGFSRLSVVAPYEAHWREARSAIGAPDLLENAKEAASLEEAIAECTLVIGTGSLAARKPEQQVVLLPSLAPFVVTELDRGGRIALVFGPEKRGLTRDDLSRCHLLVEIPTDPGQPSMNLGQAVAVCLYELATRTWQTQGLPREPRTIANDSNAPAATLDRLGDVVHQTMTAAGYSPSEMEAANRHDLRLLLRRLNLNSADARRALGVFRRILWRLERRRPQR
jgi:TrmH family RNA methyltransferase